MCIVVNIYKCILVYMSNLFFKIYADDLDEK